MQRGRLQSDRLLEVRQPPVEHDAGVVDVLSWIRAYSLDGPLERRYVTAPAPGGTLTTQECGFRAIVNAKIGAS